MSYGLVCLTCRRYVWHESLGQPRTHYCQCATLGMTPRPSLDARTPATPSEVLRWWDEERSRP